MTATVTCSIKTASLGGRLMVADFYDLEKRIFTCEKAYLEIKSR